MLYEYYQAGLNPPYQCEPLMPSLTFKEYLLDYASPETKAENSYLIEKEFNALNCGHVREKVKGMLERIEAGERIPFTVRRLSSCDQREFGRRRIKCNRQLPVLQACAGRFQESYQGWDCAGPKYMRLAPGAHI